MMQDKIEKLMSWRRDDRHSQIHLSADARDLRGGSQEGGPSFSQMLEMEMDTYEVAFPKIPSAEERSSKRHKAQGSTERDALENTTSQFMQTDFDMSSVPGQSSDHESARGEHPEGDRRARQDDCSIWPQCFMVDHLSSRGPRGRGRSSASASRHQPTGGKSYSSSSSKGPEGMCVPMTANVFSTLNMAAGMPTRV